MTFTAPTGSRRRAALTAGVIGAALALAGCAGSTPAANDTAAAGDGTFPVSIDTAYGEVTVDKKPERIVVLTSTYLELLPYIDEKPIASSEDDASIRDYSPWLSDVDRGEVTPDLVDADYAPSPEAIAALAPDLILTDIWNTDEALYEQLSEIAPTYVGVETDTQTSWQDHLASIAELTGHDPAVVDDVEADLAADFATAAAKLPGLQGKSYIVPVYFTDNQFWPTEYGNDPLMAIGLVPSDQQPHGDVTSDEVGTISQENIDKLTEDVVFVAASGAVSEEVIDQTFAALEADPRVAELPAAKNGTWLYLTGPQWTAINGGTPLSYRWWLDQVMPELEASALNQSAQ
ncbi:ABC transporter substrate-binding protein [Microbacterium sp. VKM Ac-2923]|uniref:ABC transporter substrate-binding protein n=1 Tax=Microbacterium sp. VKM Ac-2923 TaxID=2929476 RepID=UPI001FB3906E|nr:ABC transporter substrate-binding protein [Microbacterium sp. VKM Ac-2923]MCJ1708506.1 ABC transporter substrate-binding protein [Microbacterium sp. VKM Ac-2923]